MRQRRRAEPSSHECGLRLRRQRHAASRRGTAGSGWSSISLISSCRQPRGPRPQIESREILSLGRLRRSEHATHSDSGLGRASPGSGVSYLWPWRLVLYLLDSCTPRGRARGADRFQLTGLLRFMDYTDSSPLDSTRSQRRTRTRLKTDSHVSLTAESRTRTRDRAEL